MVLSGDGQHKYSTGEEGDIRRKWCRWRRGVEMRCGGRGSVRGEMCWRTTLTVCAARGCMMVGRRASDGHVLAAVPYCALSDMSRG